MTTRVRMVVTGRVQGVGFRFSCAREAKSLGLAGSVRNLPDGSVEVVVEGTAEAVNAMTQWCKTGPSFAQVLGVDRATETPLGEKAFRITR